jgi:quinol monooxygenase YgiN
VKPTNSSVHNNFADNYEKNAPEQMLLGKFEVKKGKSEDVIRLSEKLRKKTIKETGNLSFDYYFEKGSDTTIYYVEHYNQGSDIAFHLQQSYTTKFFEKLAPKLDSGLLADGEVSIYPVNTPQSSIYIEQKNGIDTFKDLLDSMPDLSMKLEFGDSSLKRTAYITNETDTSGFGTFLEFSSLQISESDWLYGIIKVDDSSASVNGIEPGNSINPSRQWMNEVGSNANILFQTKVDLSSKSNPRSIQVNTKSHYIPFRTKAKPESLFIGENFNPAAEIEIPLDSDLLIKKNKGVINYHDLTATFGNVVQGMSKVTSILQETGHYTLDTTDQPRRDLTISFNGFDKQNALDEISLVRTNEDISQIFDYESNEFATITENNIDPIIRYADQSKSIDFTDATSTIVGGYIYSPVIKHNNQYFMPSNTSSRIIGANSYEMIVNDFIYDFTIDFTKSNEMPILT